MDWARLSKEQKQQVLLAALLAVGAVYSLFMFALKPALARWGESKAELEALRTDLRRADAAIGGENRTREQLRDTAAELKRAASEFIPPGENPLSWVAGRVYQQAREVGVDIESVADIGITPVPWQYDKDTARAFIPYGVRIVTQCSYAQLVNLIDAFERNNPYLCVSALSVSGQDQNPAVHRVTLSIEWPLWASPTGPTLIREPKEESRG